MRSPDDMDAQRLNHYETHPESVRILCRAAHGTRATGERVSMASCFT